MRETGNCITLAGSAPNHLSLSPFSSSGRLQAEVVRVCVETAAAVEHLHGLSPPIIHVDLAARNVLVDVEGGRTWLADFALARRLARASSHCAPIITTAQSTNCLAWEGLPSRILAPEAPRQSPSDALPGPACDSDSSNGGLNRASDVFAFGMLLYELFTGSMPWGQRTAPATAWKLTCGGLRPPLPPAPLLDPALADLIQQCWRQDPASRPSMREVRLALQAWLDREGASPQAREPLGLTRAAAATAFVGEAAAAAIIRESLPGGLLAGSAARVAGERSSGSQRGGGAGSSEYAADRGDNGNLESLSAARGSVDAEENPCEYVRDGAA